MQDLKFTMNANGLFELATSGGDFSTVDGFETAIKVSLFTNSRLSENEASDPIRRGGWIGNIFTAKTNRQLGGKCWTLENTRLTQQTLNLAREAAKKSLNWMLEDKICRGISVVTSAQKQSTLRYDITIIARDGVKYDYIYLWDKTHAFINSPNINA